MQPDRSHVQTGGRNQGHSAVSKGGDAGKRAHGGFKAGEKGMKRTCEEAQAAPTKLTQHLNAAAEAAVCTDDG